MKKQDKIILWIILIIVFLTTWVTNAQETKISAMAGYKSLELGFTYLDEESELIYGVSASTVSGSLAEKRANTNDKGKHHEFKSDVVPAIFGLIGAKFDRLSIIGKIGGSYISQQINKHPTKDLFLALGVIIGYDINDRYSIIGGYDSVNSIQLGITFKL